MGTMQRLLAHPADQPLVHVDHSHRKSTATAAATATATATGQTIMVPKWVILKVETDWKEFDEGGIVRSLELPVNETRIGKVSAMPWTFLLGTKEMSNFGDNRDFAPDAVGAWDYITCYTYRDMSEFATSMKLMDALQPRRSFAVEQIAQLNGPEREDPFYLPMATVIPDADDPDKRIVRFSMHFVASDKYGPRAFQFTEKGKNGLAGPFRAPASWDPVGPLYIAALTQLTEEDMDDPYMGDGMRQDLMTLEHYKQHREALWEGGWNGNQRNP